MTYAITQSCCNDASCVSVCPVNCIHPTPDEPDFGTTEILYVDPRSCIDCGACADACPVDAIRPAELLTGTQQAFVEINASFYRDRDVQVPWSPPVLHQAIDVDGDPLRVAIVGTGPASSYAARHLLTSTDVEVVMFDRLPVPGGLLRDGVAPDHQDTKGAADSFAWVYTHPRTTMLMNVEVGRDITHEELLEHHHAVIYGVGSSANPPLGIPGEETPGVYAASEVVGWYNGQLSVDGASVSLTGDRAVVVGNGNVALDIARILLTDPDALARTDIAPHALEALRHSDIREVVLLGRRGPEHAAFTRPELLMLPDAPGVGVCVDATPTVEAVLDEAAPGSKAAFVAGLGRVRLDWGAPPPAGRRLVLAFHTEVTAVHRDDDVDAATVRDTTTRAEQTAALGMLLRSNGYRGGRAAGLPYDETAGHIPNDAGRVVAADGDVPHAAYVIGWAKRGARGGIGANKTCAEETIATLLRDAVEGRLRTPVHGKRHLRRLLRSRTRDLVGATRMNAILEVERRHGARQGTPRAKFTTVDDMLAATRRGITTRT